MIRGDVIGIGDVVIVAIDEDMGFAPGLPANFAVPDHDVNA